LKHAKKVTLTMSVDYDDVKALLSRKLTQPPTASGDPSMSPMTLLYSIAVAESKAEQAERARHAAEAALVVAKKQLLDHECHCHHEPYTHIYTPSSHLSRRASSVVDHMEKQSGSGGNKRDDNV
jgi:hypothetical protein